MPNKVIGVRDVGQYGIILDRKPAELPINAWSNGNNMRSRNGFMEKFYGETLTINPPTVAPYNFAPATNGAATYLWLYLGLGKAYAFDGTTHFDVTKNLATYGANADTNWVITNLMGIPVMTNGVDVPQMWTPVATGQKLLDLSNWNAAWTCNSIRAFRNFLVAFDVTKTGTRYPQMVKWSHPAASGSVPSSWDETDTTKDAGEYSVADSLGKVLDGVPLRDIMVVYKEDAIWGMQFVGGSAIFRFFKIFDFIGALSRRCAVEFTSGKHAVFGNNDLIVHDGVTKQSIVDRKMKKYFYSLINPTVYQRCFVGYNPIFNEVWFCAPTGVNTFCDTALVWNWEEDTVSLRALNNVSAMANGVITDGGADTWAAAVGSWATDSTLWDFSSFNNPSLKRLLLCSPVNSQIYNVDNTNKFNTNTFTAYVERQGIPIQVRSDQPPDMSSLKFINGIWPRIEGTVGATVNVYVGGSPDPSTDATYGPAMPFVIGTTRNLGCRVMTRFPAVKFESTGDMDWRIHGYDLEVRLGGKY